LPRRYPPSAIFAAELQKRCEADYYTKFPGAIQESGAPGPIFVWIAFSVLDTDRQPSVLRFFAFLVNAQRSIEEIAAGT
jgi:hypothetical protein